MMHQDREEVIATLATEGVPLHVSRALLRAGATLHRLAELDCSSEWADRDRVPCPGLRDATACLCEHWRSKDGQRGCGCAVDAGDPGKHHPVRRIDVKESQTRRRVEKLCAAHGLSPIFGGDPRGAVLFVKVPSGRTNDWGGRGIVVS